MESFYPNSWGTWGEPEPQPAREQLATSSVIERLAPNAPPMERGVGGLGHPDYPVFPPSEAVQRQLQEARVRSGSVVLPQVLKTSHYNGS